MKLPGFELVGAASMSVTMTGTVPGPGCAQAEDPVDARGSVQARARPRQAHRDRLVPMRPPASVPRAGAQATQRAWLQSTPACAGSPRRRRTDGGAVGGDAEGSRARPD